MRNYFLCLFPALLLLLTACEEVIDVRLNDSKPLVVIEAGLSNEFVPQTVKVSKTIAFEDSNRFNPLSGAKVFLKAPNGSTVPFREVEPGIYKSQNYQGVPGQTYTMEVEAEGMTFSATSTMPAVVKLDSLSFKRLTFFGSTNTYPVANYKDAADQQNQYRYILRVNSKVEADVVTEDRFNNGNQIADVIFYELEGLETNDRIDLEMQCIDRNVFKYYFSLQQISGEGGPPVAPANPVSNFNNGALGVFSAYTTSQYGVFVKLKRD